MKPKVAFITTLLPYPLDMGGKIKTFYRLKELSKTYDIYLFSVVDEKKHVTYEKELLKQGIVKNCFTFFHPVIAEKHRSTQLKMLFKSLLSTKPYSVYKYYKKEMMEKIQNIIKLEKIYIIWIDHITQSQYVPLGFKGKKFIDTHNYTTDFFWEMAAQDKRPFWKIFGLYEWLKYVFYEPQEIQKFDTVYAISELEKKKLQKIHNNVKLSIPDFAIPKKIVRRKGTNLFFVGLMTWYPNKDGISWFVKDIWPQVKKIVPTTTLDVVGDYGNKWKPPKADGVTFHGYIQNIEPFWKKSSLFIVPLRYGSGIRIKILEALSHGVPVVSTSKGAEGLPKEVVKHVHIADTPETFILLLNSLL